MKTFLLKCEVTHPYAGSRRMVWVERPDNPMRHGWYHDTGERIPEMRLTSEALEKLIERLVRDRAKYTIEEWRENHDP